MAEKLFSEYPGLLGATAHLRFLVWRFKRLAFGPGRVLPTSQGQKVHCPVVPYGPIIDEKWSRTHIYKKVMVPWMVRNGPKSYLCRYLSTDLSTRSIDHGRYRRSIRIHLLENTVDIRRYRRSMPTITPVAGLIFETKNREIFLERFFWREITAREQVSRAVILEKI